MAIVYALIMWSWVMVDPGHGSYVDVVGAALPTSVVERLIEKYPDDARIPASEALLPERLRKVDHWAIISDKGPELRKVAGISIRNGASETHLLYWLEGAEVSDALAVSQPQAKAGPLRAVKPERPSKAVSARLMKDVLAALGASAREDLKKKRPGPEDIELVTMKSKDGARTLAFVHIPQVEIPPSYLSAVAIIGKDGAVKKWLGKPASDLNRQEPKFLVDLEGTGDDSLVVDDMYYEGWYRALLTFDAKGEPKETPLTGDGA
ncbi:MAG: hypothetical protein CVU56_17090 [Deltaproteobacteria bacterium HGW-Deltaproteobacteria-14]|jgi:hypothetical protein|nr:MAG: hypothetical protein CVU56_17090 [Deltaproteobacteria bacterium HGW-Deltaproteobacteria-14]